MPREWIEDNSPMSWPLRVAVLQQSFCKFVCFHGAFVSPVSFLLQICAAEPGRREPLGRPQVPAQRRRAQVACLAVLLAACPSASQSAFSMLK